MPQGLDLATAANPEQIAAVTHGDGAQLVLAGAGSGKTRVITYRVAWLIEDRGIAAEEVTAVTFTNKAAAEMRERIETLLGRYPLASFVGTFHRLALRLLRAYGERVGLPRGFAIVDASDQESLVKKAMKAVGLEDNFRPQAVLAAISAAKNRLIEPAAYAREADDFFRRRVAPVYARYQELLGSEAQGVDFDDMILLAVKLLRQDEALAERVRRRTRHLLVDEFQDTNEAQLELVKALHGPAREGRSLTAVGDEDQGIYRWRGADPDNILAFERHFPGAAVRKLERNYRSTQTILDAAGAVVANNEKRRGKTLWTDAGAGEKLLLYRGQDDQDEARWVVSALLALEAEGVPLAATAILVRTHGQTRTLEEELLRRRVPYTLIGGLRFYERAEIKDLIAYLRLLANPADALSFERVLNRPPRGIGKATQERLRERAAERGESPFDVLAADALDGFGARAAQALRRFYRLVEGLRAEAAELPLPALLRRVIEATEYASLFDPNDDDGRGRLENVDELLSAAQAFRESQAFASETGDDLLAAFLDHAALASSDEVARDRALALMTLHSAKGLEFDAVVIAGLEDNLLPHWNSQALPEDLEEERRLLYVGMTRARARLILSHCRRRRVAGQYQDQVASRFLDEIPAALLDVEESPELVASWTRVRSDVDSFFRRGPATLGRGLEAPAAAGEEPGRDWRRGLRVRHASLGIGEVLAVEGEGDDVRLTVLFRSAGRRKLVARYASLERL